ncbi:MAG: hypothetical protein KC486_20985 [Myxococcales bacterium]|nr:hypothetical protein [Myxococcales bacterium]
MDVVDADPTVGAPRWLRNRRYDLTLIVGVLLLALLLGGVAWAIPGLFFAVLLVDLWLLAYPHVAATYTRIALLPGDRRRYRYLLLVAPPAVLLGTAGVAWFGGLVALSSLYFFWQSWHYTRQSFGIARAYGRASATPPERAGGLLQTQRLVDVVVYAFPLWGVLRRAHEDPGTFYGAPLWCPPTPALAVDVAAAIALAALALWLLRELRAWRRGDRRRLPQALFVLSHVAITTVSYLLIADVTRGWLFINIWHNAQYLLFVWAANAQRFADPEPATGLARRISQPGWFAAYALACVAVSAAFYVTLGAAAGLLAWTSLPALLILHQTANFHHYVVDAVIWRRPRTRHAAQG